MKQKPLNLLIDCSFINRRLSCISSHYIYTGSLIKGFQEYSPFHIVALVAEGYEDYIDTLADGRHIEKIVISTNAKVLSYKIDRLLGIIPFKKDLERYHIDAVITPYTTPYIYIYPKKFHQFSIIHDLIAYQQSFFRLSSLMMKSAVKRIPHFITISEYTRNEVKKAFGKDSTVIYNCIPIKPDSREELIADIVGKKYILDVNRFERYKNAETLIRALHLIRKKLPHIIYLKGYNSVSSDICYLQRVISSLNMESRVIIDSNHRNEAEMRYLYTHADLFVTPSLEEGFGYTPIEAAVLKTPVLVSDIPVLKEVTQGKIESFNPHLPEELAEKMCRIISNPPSDEERTALSDFYLKEYSLEKQIERFTEVIMNNVKQKL